MERRTTGRWSSVGAPTRRQLAGSALTVALAALSLWVVESVFWPWIGVGFVSFAAATGPVAASSVGSRVGAWFRAIGYEGRVIAIVAFVAAVWISVPLLEIPAGPLVSFANGGLLGVSAVVFLEAARSGLESA
ncbi:hypothetical protein QA600_03240 [Natronococcus sp. A-GB1]|uniref:hypothetical protein n=1 Tax=Natronococcus sp. A-GB1 TaxID=3037648 RepID=UPI00241F245D|nr:hypothetical protein [Natronococcus sp. A-GB1]MDG5758351.1 hypothetical protein [Natronococcus sp. A-GB1]